MKKLYLQFYCNKIDPIPWDVYFACVDNCGTGEMIRCIKQEAYNISVFMESYPDGKVDFTWK